MKIFIEKMKNNDFSAIMNIYQQGIQTNIATFQTTCPTFEKWNNEHINTCRFVARIQNKIVGWVALSSTFSCCTYSGVAELSIYVDNKAKKQGFGSALLEKVLQESEKEGF